MVTIGRQRLGSSVRANRRATAAQIAAGGLANLSATLFALAQKREEAEQKRKEKEVLSSQQLLPLLRFQAQMARWDRKDLESAERRKVDLEDRKNAQALAEKKEARLSAHAGVIEQIAADRLKRGDPTEVAIREGIIAATRAVQHRKDDLEEMVPHSEAKDLGVPEGTRRKDVIGRSSLAADKRVNLAKTIAFFEQGAEVAGRLLPDLDLSSLRGRVYAPIELGKAKLQRYMLAKEGNPDAVFLENIHGHGTELARNFGETGNVANADTERALSTVDVDTLSTRGQAVAKFNLERGRLVGSLKGYGITEEELRPEIEAFKEQYRKLSTPPAPPAAPAAAGMVPGAPPPPTSGAPAVAPQGIDLNEFLQRHKAAP